MVLTIPSVSRVSFCLFLIMGVLVSRPVCGGRILGGDGSKAGRKNHQQRANNSARKEINPSTIATPSTAPPTNGVPTVIRIPSSRSPPSQLSPMTATEKGAAAYGDSLSNGNKWGNKHWSLTGWALVLPLILLTTGIGWLVKRHTTKACCRPKHLVMMMERGCQEVVNSKKAKIPPPAIPREIELMPVHTFDDVLTVPEEFYVFMEDSDAPSAIAKAGSLAETESSS